MRVLIVEDELVIRNGMLRHIPWAELGIAEVKPASNAEEALAISRENAPDVIISDISLPGMDGIALCRALRESFPELEIIFVTGYADKEYLKAAIELHAVRYVEKPVNRQVIQEAVEEAVKRIRVKRQQKAAYLHAFLLDPESAPPFYGEEDVLSCVGILRGKEKGGLARIRELLAARFSPEMERRGRDFLMEYLGEDSLVLFLAQKGRTPDRADFVRKVSGMLEETLEGTSGWFLTFGSTAADAGQIADSYRSAQYAQRALSFMGWDHILFEEELREGAHRMEPDPKLADRFVDAVAAKDAEQAQELLEELYRELLDGQVFLSGDVRYLYYSLNQTLERARRAFRPGEVSGIGATEAEDFFDQACTLEEMHTYLKERLSQVLESGAESKSTYVIKKVTDYIWQNYGDANLSIKVLADHVYLTPTYLSSLFKKNVGITVGQYLLDVRVENAKRLMKDHQLKLYQIASQVGYEDANYFAKIFKKKTGMTPSEYKENLSLK